MNVIEFQINDLLEGLSYDELKNLEPKEDCTVSIFNKETNQYVDKMVYRKYQSFGVSPVFQNTNKSFMFNHQTPYVPKELEKYLLFAQSLNSGYNNCYVNWYDSGKNYIEPHSDCTSSLVPNSQIMIINLNEGAYEKTFKIQHKNGGSIREIKLSNGKCLLFNSKEQEQYRHWVDQEETEEGRISITLRMVKTN